MKHGYKYEHNTAIQAQRKERINKEERKIQITKYLKKNIWEKIRQKQKNKRKRNSESKRERNVERKEQK